MIKTKLRHCPQCQPAPSGLMERQALGEAYALCSHCRSQRFHLLIRIPLQKLMKTERSSQTSASFLVLLSLIFTFPWEPGTSSRLVPPQLSPYPGTLCITILARMPCSSEAGWWDKVHAISSCPDLK